MAGKPSAYDTTQPATLDAILRAYGWTLAYLKSQPDLYKLVQQATHPAEIPAVAGGGPMTRFGAVKGTPAKPGPVPTLGQFNDQLKGTQWFIQGAASQETQQTAQTAQAIAGQNNLSPAAKSGGGFDPTAGSTSTGPFSNLYYTWGDPNNPAFTTAKVWMGTPGPKTVKTRGGLVPANQPVQVGAAQFMENYFNASRAEVTRLQESLVGLGKLHPGYDPGTFDAGTQAALREVLFNVNQYNDPNVTIDGYLARGSALYKTASAPHTSTTNYYTSLIDAEGAYQKVALRLLGRGPTTAESTAAAGALHSAEVANPASSTTTTNPITGDSHTTTVGGVGGLSGAGAQSVLEAQARQSPDYGPFQAVSTYFPVLMNLLGGLTTGGQ